MLVTMLVKLLFPTYHSPNQRIQPWDGKDKKPALAGFLLAVFFSTKYFCSESLQARV
jgi:hypothetical protein